MTKEAVTLLVNQLEEAFTYLEDTVKESSHEHLHFQPGGTANSIASNYAHAVFGADEVLNLILLKHEPFYLSTWKEKTGASQLPPPWGSSADIVAAWNKNVKVDLIQFSVYAAAVKNAFRSYIQSKNDDELRQELEMSMGKKQIDWIIYNFVIFHVVSHTGEIAVLRGLQGLKGLPF